MGDEDDDHTTNAPTVWFEEVEEEDAQLPDALARQPVESSPVPVHPDGSLVFGNHLSDARGLIPGTIPPRSGNIPRDGPVARDEEADPSSDEDGPVSTRFISLHPTRNSTIVQRISGPGRTRRVPDPHSPGYPEFARRR